MDAGAIGRWIALMSTALAMTPRYRSVMSVLRAAGPVRSGTSGPAPGSTPRRNLAWMRPILVVTVSEEDSPLRHAKSGGRPRHDEVDRGHAIIRVVLETVFQQGLAAATIEGIARRAGIAKTTIYRGWPNREAMIIEALSTVYMEFEPPDTGDVRHDLRWSHCG